MQPCRQPELQTVSLVGVLVESYAEILVLQGHLTDAQALEVATRAVEELLLRLGGRKWYFPKPDAQNSGWHRVKQPLQERDRAIRQAWRRGTPVVVILRTYRLKKSQFYKILANKEPQNVQP